VARHAGIEVRHRTTCASRDGGRCGCSPGYQAHVWSAREHKRIRKTFATLAEARAWRQETQVAIRRRTMNAPSRVKLRELANAWIEGAEAGVIRNRSGDPYKPSVIRGYTRALRSRILPELGEMRVSDLARPDLQEFADRAPDVGSRCVHDQDPFIPLRAIFRRAFARGEVAVNPRSAWNSVRRRSLIAASLRRVPTRRYYRYHRGR